MSLKPIEPQPHQPIVQGYDNYLLQLTPLQEATLEEEFARTKSIHEADLAILAAEIGLDETEAQVIQDHSLLRFLQLIH